MNNTGLGMECAPKDRAILVWAAPREDLNGFYAITQWHPDAGFCVDELREPVRWWPLPTHWSLPDWYNRLDVEPDKEEDFEELLEKAKAEAASKNIDAISLELAKQIEDAFAQGWPGGRGQRLAAIQVLITSTFKR